jgi:hypothetical protein
VKKVRLIRGPPTVDGWSLLRTNANGANLASVPHLWTLPPNKKLDQIELFQPNTGWIQPNQAKWDGANPTHMIPKPNTSYVLSSVPNFKFLTFLSKV